MTAAVVIPVYKTYNRLEEYELTSLRQTLAILGKHAIVFIAPLDLDLSGYQDLCTRSSVGFNRVLFQRRYFKDIDGYSRLLLSPLFYSSFKTFDYILICQTDAYVFADELFDWCSRQYDFIGAPWVFRDKLTGEVKMKVGNGGFSLRKVNSHLKALHSFKRYKTTGEILSWYRNFNLNGKIGQFPLLLSRLAGFRDNIYHRFNHFEENEDIFWTVNVPRLLKWFTVAPPAEAMKFSMELEPSYLFELNGRHLPFGCHAFQKYEPAFWQNHIHAQPQDIHHHPLL